MSFPLAIQLSRRRGWKLPPNTVLVSRLPGDAGIWGNPYTGGDDGPPKPNTTAQVRVHVVKLFRELLRRPERAPLIARARRELTGSNLACWCSLCEQHKTGRPLNVICEACQALGGCHRDVWGEILYGAPTIPSYTVSSEGLPETVLYYRHGPNWETRGAAKVRVESECLVGVATGAPLVDCGPGQISGRSCHLVRFGKKRLMVFREEWERARRRPAERGNPE